ncbi:MAG: hypothetical protein CSA72_08835 [Rhodobacterales bacterium]|nr:MAG: hypothetical protein CSA72_08835 [Rhodobacterales bacterium]
MMGEDTRTIEIDLDVHRAIESARRSLGESELSILKRLLFSKAVERDNDSSRPEELDRSGINIGADWSNLGVTLPHGTLLKMTYNGQVQRGQINDGRWVIGDVVEHSPSGAACAIARTRTGASVQLNGWRTWSVKRPGDVDWISLQALRKVAATGGEL